MDVVCEWINELQKYFSLLISFLEWDLMSYVDEYVINKAYHPIMESSSTWIYLRGNSSISCLLVLL